MDRRIFWVNYFLGILLSFFFCTHATGQKITVHSGFLTDSVGIGEQTRYYLVARYPSKLNVLFPDSTYDFKPFELEKKYFAPTKTTDSLSYDSAVYYLSTFDVSSLQSLALPVFVVNRKDSVLFYAEADSIKLIELVHHVPDSLSADKLPLKMNTAYQKVSFLINYPIVVIISTGLLITLLVLLLIFGKRIRKHFKLRKLRKNHQKFLETYTLQLSGIKKAFSPSTAESVLITWKKYLEQLEAKPYTKFTTREILSMDGNGNLNRDLNAIDKAIYGHDSQVEVPLENLRNDAVEKFLRKLEEVKHG